MLESMVEWMSYPLYYAYDGAPPPTRNGAAHATIYPYGPFPTGDGKTVMLGLQNEREWAVFCDKVLRAAGARDRRALFVQRRARTAAREELCAHHRRGLRDADGGAGRRAARRRADRQRRINDMADVWAHPQLQARAALDRGATRRRADAGAAAAGRRPTRSTPRMDAVPALGQHTARDPRRAGLQRGRDRATARQEGAT